MREPAAFAMAEVHGLDAIRHMPLTAAAATVAIVALIAAIGLALRWLTRRLTSLRAHILALTLSGIVGGTVASIVLARSMILEASQLGTVVVVLAMTASFATFLVIIGSTALGRDVEHLERVVRDIEAGDRSVRSNLRRNDELGHVAFALDHLTIRLGQLEEERAGIEAERTMMLSSIGHDLRSPLAALKAALEALVDGVATDPERYLRSMQADVDALTALVDDLSLLSRIESGRLDLVCSVIDLTECLDEAVEALTPMARAREVSLVLDATQHIRVNGNATALGRISRNLIDNAIRHAPPGSAVSVRVSGEERPTVQVIDTGFGFPSDFAAHAFDRFTRADESRTRTSGGTGLGLAIARGLVEAHGGRIWIEPAPGGHVAFDLPALLAI